MEQFVATQRQCLQIIRQPQAAQFPVDVAEAVDAVDDFLADVTAFVVTHGPVFDAAFQRQIGLVHVHAKPRNACLDARGFKRLPATGPSANLFGRRNELVRHLAERGIGDEKVEAGAVGDDVRSL